MSVPMKKRLTEVSIGNENFKVPLETARAVLVLLKGSNGTNEEVVLSNESGFMQSLDSRYGRPGVCLRGARVKEGLSQTELADKLGISQSNLSKMELGKRPIGKTMAKRIAAALRVDYRMFL